MKEKKSSYQRMKERYEKRIEELTKDILTLVEDKDFIESQTVKIRWKTKILIEKTIWQGDNL